MKVIKEHIFNIIIGILCIVLVSTTWSAGSEFIRYMKGYAYDEEDFLSCIRIEDYSSMVEYLYKNEVNDVKTTAGMEECYAVARYYEAASMYKAYKAVGRNTEAEEKKRIMEGQITEMGELSYVIEDILTYLELEMTE